ncbi:MAG: ubiquitin-like domain-containing protein [bacterium]|nr:ubiquitin-like domain-containing protein [bacterium]
MHYKFQKYKLRSRRWARKIEKRYRDHPKIIHILTGISLFGIVLVLGITLRGSAVTLKKRDANIVILHSDNKSKVLPTRELTVGDFLKNAGVVVNEGDLVEPTIDTEIEEDNFRINVYRGAPIIIDDGGKTRTAFSAGQTPRSIAEQAGLKLYPEDIVSSRPSQDFLREGIAHKISIVRSTPVNINLYGKALTLRTHTKTVGELLAEKNVKLAEDDSVKPGLNTELSGKLQIFVTRFGSKIITEELEIAMPEDVISDNSLSFGTTVLRQKGSPGKKSVTYQLELKNGREVGRKVIQEIVVTEPVKQIVARGTLINIPSDKTAAMNAAGIRSSDHAYVNYIVSRESGWNVFANNASSGAYGLCQALPGSKMASAGDDWRTNAVTQLKWCSGYAIGRYGSWQAAYNFWLSHHWW